ncbi:FMN-binding glutamate synthase family protein [Methylibium sp. Pch-M]|uniref:FMN-binding glutamate synthase family protein n=1 Tax=unclassified Methylibium TaxID=2633235 RepID=UPI0003F3DAF5|nr:MULTISPECIES: FMN-binding glutamate synthase family protein [unclassified Methylibium]EWS52850.1 Glutamate synthase [NADPH] large chain precursor [Methylibium sp. T29]EWS57499.1 Glutamate synthase [NADPH] large chain precursor [Methylibium sp. T29-B]QAZ39372.1 FMN-binding glutamate synthase family protein [Methylibium sp. Pch-M]
MPAWLLRLNEHFPIRYVVWLACAVGALLSALVWVVTGSGGLVLLVFLALVGTGVHDVRQSRHSVLRNYPVIGHLRFFFEFIRPEMRQYFIEGDNEAAPFSRQQRSLVYQRAKGEPDKRPFGTQHDVGAEGYEWINHSIAPTTLASHDFRITVGGERAQPYSASIFNISAMSFGALSANAILALNAGAKRGGFAHDTGEGSISRYHREHGGDLIWEIGSGYFGCRHDDGSFSEERFAETARDPQVKMIELKLSQGAKPGHGGVLPGPKVTSEIAAARGVAVGVDCVSPSRHAAFDSPVGMLQFIEKLRTLSGGKPVGFKLCIGHPWEWFAIAKAMRETHLLPDFIVVDGAEGGTGAAPLEFTDHVGAPLQEGLMLVHNTLTGIGLRDRIQLGCAGKVVSAFDIARLMALGADWCNAGRGFMFALGCIQAQACHTGHCPTGVTTQDPMRQKALVVPTKADRVFMFHQETLRALKELVQAAGLQHPREITAAHIVRRVADHEVKLLATLLPFVKPGALLAAERGEIDWPHQVFRLYWPRASAHSFLHQPDPLATAAA